MRLVTLSASDIITVQVCVFYLRNSNPATRLQEVLHISPTLGHGEFRLPDTHQSELATAHHSDHLTISTVTLTTAGEGTWMLGTDRGRTWLAR